MSLRKRGAFWHIDLWHRGKRVRKPTGFRIEQETDAQRYHDELKADLWKKPVITGHSWYEAQILWLQQRTRSYTQRCRLNKINRYFKNCALSEISEESFDCVLNTFNTSGTYNRYLNDIVAILNLARRKKWIKATPQFIRKKQTKGRVRWLYKDQWEKLYKELPAHLKPLALFSIETGLRKSNVTQLEWSQIDMQRKCAWIHPDQSKNGEALAIRLSNKAVTVLKAQEGRSERFVFPNKDKPFRDFKNGWHSALKRAGITDFVWHDLRHTWAAWHVMNGTSLQELQQLGGWKSYSMVLRYAHLAPEHLAKVANNVKPISRDRHTKASHDLELVA